VEDIIQKPWVVIDLPSSVGGKAGGLDPGTRGKKNKDIIYFTVTGGEMTPKTLTRYGA
jgi:hypothetical protein